MLKAIMQAVAALMRRPPSLPAYARSKRAAGGTMSYELLIEQREPIDGWTVCTICLNLDRTTAVQRKRWRCTDCGVDSSNGSQHTLKDYLTENSLETIANNLAQWSNVKGARAAYRMLRSARYKCLLTLGKRLRAEPGGPLTG